MDIKSLNQVVTKTKQLCYNSDKRNCRFAGKKDNWVYGDVCQQFKKKTHD